MTNLRLPDCVSGPQLAAGGPASTRAPQSPPELELEMAMETGIVGAAVLERTFIVGALVERSRRVASSLARN